MLKEYIKDEEFDKMNYYQQINYKWCPKCDTFYNFHLVNNCECESKHSFDDKDYLIKIK